MPARPIAVRAPATSANLGPGLDCLGLALDLWNEVVALPGAPPEPDSLVLAAARAVFRLVGEPFPGFGVRRTDRIPPARGLGSSAAALSCGLLLANRYLDDPLDRPALLRLAAELEGHPDNVVPCLLGGARAAALGDDGRVLQAEVPVGLPLRAVVFMPEARVPTRLARAVLPSRVPLADALFNVGRASLLVTALATGAGGLLAEATRDRLHQPYRAGLFPAGTTLIEAALGAGALGAYLSGAGPAVLALCDGPKRAQRVAVAVEEAARLAGAPGESLALSLSPRGAHVVEGD